MTVPADLYAAAANAHRNAYSPYSHYRVGAGIRLASGEVFGGCNVENASYGATICAERSAIMAAVSAHGPIQIVEVLVLTDASPPWPPCGLCRQVIAEFASPDCQVWCCNPGGDVVVRPFSKLFPQGFDATHMA
jgi:cytidine deaminase